MKKRPIAMCICGVLLVGTGGAAAASASSPKPKSYPNCTALNAVFRHGVARKGAHDKTSGKPVTNFTVNAKVYTLNTARDRDKDGIACEKR